MPQTLADKARTGKNAPAHIPRAPKPGRSLLPDPDKKSGTVSGFGQANEKPRRRKHRTAGLKLRAATPQPQDINPCSTLAAFFLGGLAFRIAPIASGLLLGLQRGICGFQFGFQLFLFGLGFRLGLLGQFEIASSLGSKLSLADFLSGLSFGFARHTGFDDRLAFSAARLKCGIVG